MVVKSLKIILFVSLLYSFNNEADSCVNFRLGIYDVNINNESETKFRIVRTESGQIETNEFDDKVYYTIKWINDCSYIQKFDKNKMKLTDEMKMINKDGGVVIELLQILNDSCVSYQSYVKNFKNLSLKKGSFCKISYGSKEKLGDLKTRTN